MNGTTPISMASDASTAKAYFNCGIGLRGIDIGDRRLCLYCF